MLSGVAKSGSPISRWTMRFPSASRRRALASTSNALSVPRRDMRSANRMLTFGMLMDPEQRAAVDPERLAGDVSRLLRAEECARCPELRRVAQATHRRGRRLLLDPLLGVGSRRDRQRPRAVGEDGIGGEAVDGDAVGRELARQG